MKKTLVAGILSALMLCNVVVAPAIMAAPAAVSIDKDYDPFAEEEGGFKELSEEEIKQLPLKERAEYRKALKEQEAKKQQFKVTEIKPGNVYIPKGLKLNAELVDDASSKTNKENDIVDIRITENLIINGTVVIEKGTIGKGYVYRARKAGGFGRKGRLEIAAHSVETVNGIVVPLKQGLSGKGKSDGGAVAVTAVVSIVGGAFMKGTNVNYPAGTNFEVEVRSDVDLNCTPETLEEAMNPNIPRGKSIIIKTY